MTGLPPQPLDASPEQRIRADDGDKPQTVPKGVVIGPDGKPCRTCTSGAAWKSMMKSTTKATPPTPTTPTTTMTTTTTTTTTPPTRPPAASPPPPSCPPDVEELGRASWTLLHTLAAQYPSRPSITQQTEARQFLTLFGKLYPCGVCGEDFRAWMREEGHQARVSSREEFGRWMCEAHNAVNVKLGKREFDCERWEERWRTGWKDGSCD